jgi:hypothetical protein
MADKKESSDKKKEEKKGSNLDKVLSVAGTIILIICILSSLLWFKNKAKQATPRLTPPHLTVTLRPDPDRVTVSFRENVWTVPVYHRIGYYMVPEIVHTDVWWQINVNKGERIITIPPRYHPQWKPVRIPNGTALQFRIHPEKPSPRHFAEALVHYVKK